ncbi:pyridoxine 5'-phosphate synthase [uncultured Victivallis sp.]|uniref:pyridoxine 5'-phosphate synthase n=1 Tax=Victivallis sp. TaxID=2049020 RepID=UPI0025CF4649|nr:pyridoxine 5'-phosphate synthase [uncultured Victivallis sp.]
MNLGVNIDHVATVRQARLAERPSPLEAALLAEEGGAWGITAHLREDRRHIQDRDIEALVARVHRLNMEMAVTPEMLEIAVRVRPHSCCLVPEKRAELTTEGGLDVAGQPEKIREAVARLKGAGIVVSCFIDPEEPQLAAAAAAGADYVELHTGTYSNAAGEARAAELERLKLAAEFAHAAGLRVNAGHGIDYENIAGILTVPHLCELNIGHSIVGRAIMVGMVQAVREMVQRMQAYRG